MIDEYLDDNDEKVTFKKMNKYELFACFSPYLFVSVYFAWNYINS